MENPNSEEKEKIVEASRLPERKWLETTAYIPTATMETKGEWNSVSKELHSHFHLWNHYSAMRVKDTSR